MHSIPIISRLLLFASIFTSALPAEDVEIIYDEARKVPIAADTYQAAGKTIGLTLAIHPGAGTDLTVIDHTGTDFIAGTFTNLAHGQLVQLEYQGIIYSFVANYYAGTGNDLVLQWANRRLVGWGDNQKGQLGNSGSGKTGPGVWVDTRGVLAGKVITQVAVGAAHAVALCSDGTLAAWGYNYYGQLGDGRALDSYKPVLVNRDGVLAGKTVIKVACGEYHSLALCSDGTLAAWGTNQSAQLGDGTTISRTLPVAVDRSGVLAGKTVVGIAAAEFHNLVLCSDGFMATWGGNTNGKLGNGGTAASMVPVAVVQSGVLAGKTVSSIAVGSQHSLVLCSDGTLASWGANSLGQLGNSSVASSNVPVLVRTSGVLAGRTPVSISAGHVHSLALCSDGFLAGWGGNGARQLGSSSSLVPIAMPAGGALVGRTISRMAGGIGHTVLYCTDSSIVAWGYNLNGELAHDTGSNATSTRPLLADRITLPAGSRFIDVTTGHLSFSNIATVALPVPPVAQTLAASEVTDTGAKLNAKVNPAGTNCTVRFEYGLTAGYGLSIAATPDTLSGMGTVEISAALENLRPDTIYHYRVTATVAGETIYGMDSTFKTTDAATLASLGTSYGGVLPPVGTHQSDYHLIVPHGIAEIQVTPVATHATSTIRLEGRVISPAAPDSNLPLAVGPNEFDIRISSVDGINHMTYTLSVTRLPENLVVDSSGSPPVVIRGGTIPMVPTRVILNHKPLPGNELTLIRHDGMDLLQGVFDNLKHGDVVKLDHAGNTYFFIADYAGGDGNDLVLRWKNSRMMAWGYNNLGQLGTGGTNNRNTPTPVVMTGALAGKTISRLSAGEYHSLALCTDGTIAAWGSNSQGELGANSGVYSSPIPILVDRSGVLAGKRVVDVCAGGYYSAALCSDGTVATWGGGSNGTLGNNDAQDSPVPVAVDTSGALKGRRIVAISAGFSHMLALCSDGTLVTWGNDQYGQLGTGIPIVSLQFERSLVPYQVVRGITSGKSVSSISAGGYHNLVGFTDGSLASWGAGFNGQLGNNSNTGSSMPVWVDQSGILTGKTPKSQLAGSYSSLAFCTDGTIAIWGMINSSLVPLEFPYVGALAGKSLRAVIGNGSYFHAITTEGSMVGWGANYYGQIGNGNNLTSDTPSQVSTAALRQGEVFVDGSSASFHTLALVASPLQSPATLAPTGISGTSATLRGTVTPNSNAVSLRFEYGTDTSYGGTATASPATASGLATAAPIAILSGLTPGTTYHYRLVATGEHAVIRGADMTFTTLSDNARLAGIGLEAGTLSPAFDPNQTSYITTVSHETETIKLTPLAEHPGATVTVNGNPAGSDIPLSVGQNPIRVAVTAEDGIAKMSYTVEITRIPGVFRFNTARDVPLTVDRLAPGTVGIRLQLGFAPAPGAVLTAINVTGPGFIDGRFANLPHGARVTLNHDGVDYTFVANYHGGTGNDLVLQWADTGVLTWGYNRYGQLGNGTTANRSVPGPIVRDAGFPPGLTCTALASGYLHTLALCADGSLFSWGYNIYGQLGTGDSSQSSLPVRVDLAGALARKTVVAIACGTYHNLALCSDGTLASWGYNNYGQLGTGDTATRKAPASVVTHGALVGKHVVGIAAGAYHSAALCSDGTVVAWGFNDDGELGNGNTAGSTEPVAVDRSGALAGKTVIAIAAGQYHTLALCSDGTLCAWGYNKSGQCGVPPPAGQPFPVALDSAGSLGGRRISQIAAGSMHSVARAEDGSVHAWGSNSHGQLAQPAFSHSATPATVAMPPALDGIPASGLAAGAHHSLACFPDGSFASWGANSHGQLGTGTTTAAWTATSGGPAAPLVFGAGGSSAMHGAAIAALPPTTGTARIGSTSGESTAADFDGDDDNDGISNLIEYAFGLDPRNNSAGKLPEWQMAGDHMVASFTKPPGVSAVHYAAEWSHNLRHWNGIPDSGHGDLHVFSVKIPTHGSLFLRLKVVKP
jgi:alpha-tubulin suppressor-like RCC1 family protein